MTAEKQKQCLALLLAIAMEGRGTSLVAIQPLIRGFLKTIDPEEVAKAAEDELLEHFELEDTPANRKHIQETVRKLMKENSSFGSLVERAFVCPVCGSAKRSSSELEEKHKDDFCCAECQTFFAEPEGCP